MADRTEDLLGVLKQIGSRDETGTDTSEEGENSASVETTGTEEVEPVKAPAREGSFTPKRAFSYRRTHPLYLDMKLLEKYGPQWLEWEPETIWSEIKDDFGAGSISVHVRNKINAMKLMHVADTPWSAWEVFAVVCQALNDNIPDFRILQKPSPDQIIAAVNIMQRVKRLEFSEEVARFIAACFLDDGVFFLPPPVSFAQIFAAQPEYKCSKCDNIDTDEGNNMCDSCGAPQSALKLYYKRDFRPVRDRFNKVIADGDKRDYDLEENPVDVQVAKLVRAVNWSRELDARLAKQTGAANG